MIVLLFLLCSVLSGFSGVASQCTHTVDLFVSPITTIGSVQIDVAFPILVLKYTLDPTWSILRSEIYLSTVPPDEAFNDIPVYTDFPYVYTFSPPLHGHSRKVFVNISSSLPSPFNDDNDVLFPSCNGTVVYLAAHFGAQKTDPLLVNFHATGWLGGNYTFPNHWANYDSIELSCTCETSPSLIGQDIMEKEDFVAQFEDYIPMSCSVLHDSLVVVPTSTATHTIAGSFYITAFDELVLVALVAPNDSLSNYHRTKNNDETPLFNYLSARVWLGTMGQQPPFIEGDPSGKELTLVMATSHLNSTLAQAEKDGDMFTKMVAEFRIGEDLPLVTCGQQLQAVIELQTEVVFGEYPPVTMHGFGLNTTATTGQPAWIITFTYCCSDEYLLTHPLPQNQTGYEICVSPAPPCTAPISFWRNAHLHIQKYLNHKYVNRKQWDGKVDWPLDPENTEYCGLSLLTILWTNPLNRTWYILAQQYVTATLNIASGSPPHEIYPELITAYNLLISSCDDFSLIDQQPQSSTNNPRELAAILSLYNSGLKGPARCTHLSNPLADYVPPDASADYVPPASCLPPLSRDTPVYATPTCSPFYSTPFVNTNDSHVTGTCPVSSYPIMITAYGPELLTKGLYGGQVMITNDGSLARVGFVEISGFHIDHVAVWMSKPDDEVPPLDDEGRLWTRDAGLTWDMKDDVSSWISTFLFPGSRNCGDTVKFVMEVFLVDTNTNATGLAGIVSGDYVLCCPLPTTRSQNNTNTTETSKIVKGCVNNHLFWRNFDGLSSSLTSTLCDEGWNDILRERVNSSNQFWLVLAQQWITAKLNIEQGVTPSNLSIIDEVGSLLEAHCSSSDRLQNDLATNETLRQSLNALTRFNNGYQRSAQACSAGGSRAGVPQLPRVYPPPACTCLELTRGDNILSLYFRTDGEEFQCFTYPVDYNVTLLSLSSSVDYFYLISENGVSFVISSNNTATTTTDEEVEEEEDGDYVTEEESSSSSTFTPLVTPTIAVRAGQPVLLVASGERFATIKATLIPTGDSSTTLGKANVKPGFSWTLFWILFCSFSLIAIIIVASVVYYKKKHQQRLPLLDQENKPEEL